MTAVSSDHALPPPPGGTLRVASRVASSARIVAGLLWGASSRPPTGEEQRALRDATRRLAEACADLCDAHGIEVVIRGEPPVGAAALVSNHVGYIDPLAILARVPGAPIAKREVSEWPLIGDAMDRSGVLWVDRECSLSGAYVLRRARRAFASDVPVLVFPEGTTTTGDDALPFRRGLFGIAAREGVPIVPVTLRYGSPDIPWVGDQEFLPHYLRTARRRRTTVTVHFHERLRPAPGESAELLAARARAVVRATLREHARR